MLRYRPEIDGLRALAIVPIVLFHSGLVRQGFVGVDLFFVVSGYLITSLLKAEFAAGRFALADFYERRARRLLPALLVVLAATVPCAMLLLPRRDMVEYSESLASVALFGSNVLFWQESGYFDAAAELKPLLHTWSLAVEEQYYILFPLVLAGLWRWAKGVTVAMLGALTVASLLIAQWLLARDADAAFYLLPSRGWEILLGALCAFVPATVLARCPRPLREMAAVVGVVLLALGMIFITQRTSNLGWPLLVPTLGGALLILFARDGVLVQRLLSLKPLVGVGLISYSAYLWHQPLFVFYRRFTVLPAATGKASLAYTPVVVLTFVLAWLTWRLVEQPFRNRDWLSRKRIFALSGLGMALVLIVGLAGALTEGFQFVRKDLPIVQRTEPFVRASIERTRLIRTGLCNYHPNGSYGELATFLANWDCRSDDEGLRDSRLLVTGDSHASDTSMALRLHGVDVAQINAPGCAVAPPFAETFAYCEPVLNKAREIVQQQKLRGVIVVSRFPNPLWTRAYMQSLLDYWSQWPVPVLILSPMPDATRQYRQYEVTGRATVRLGMRGERAFFSLLQGMELPPNVRILNGGDLWCDDDGPDDRHPCSVIRAGQVMASDPTHLSPAGARIYGANLLATPEMQQMLARR